jgi:hypothetical protein
MTDRPASNANLSPNLRLTRKPYQAPTLVKWGTLRDITLSAGSSSSNSDGAMKQPNRTS